MKSRISIILALSLLAMLPSVSNAQVKFFSNFECGRLGKAELTDSSNIFRPNLVYNITSAKDPDNPVDTLLEPSSRWFYFLMTGVKGRTITLKFIDTEPWAPMIKRWLQSLLQRRNMTGILCGWHIMCLTQTLIWMK